MLRSGPAAIVFAFSVSFLPGQASVPVASKGPADIVARYHLADRLLRGELASLSPNSDMQARFADARMIVYHFGPLGGGEIRKLLLPDGRSATMAHDSELAASIARLKGSTSGIDIARGGPRDIDYDPVDDQLIFSWGGRWIYSHGRLRVAENRSSVDDDPGLSPDGRIRIVARNFNLFAVDTRTHNEVALTHDGSVDQPYGRGIAPLDIILAQGTETPELPVSVRWSPDSRHLLTWRLDTRDVPFLSMTQQNPPGSLYPRSFHYIYPTAGAPVVPKASLFVVDAAEALQSGTPHMQAAAVPSEELLYPADPEMDWVGNQARTVWTERGYRKQEVYTIGLDGTAHVVAREVVKPLVEVTATSFQPSPELGGELVISERTGWAQLYLVKPDTPDGGQALTQGSWEVLSVDRVDGVGKSILITGIGREANRNPYWHSLYRVGLDGAPPKLLTPEPLNHETTISDDGRYAIDRMSSPTVPTRTVVRDLSDGHIVTELGHADASAIVSAGFAVPEPFKGVAADGRTSLYAMIYRPAHFDRSRHYPVIDEVYTGPTMSVVPTNWSDALGAEAESVAQLGAVVVIIDGTGTSNRGQAFRLAAYRNLGEVGLDDHIAMIRQIAARYPYVDVDRAGVYGCSAGGYDAARFILRRPDFFKVSVASSGNHDERLDKAWWPEASMGNADVATWDRNSNMRVASQLKGKLLLVHGDIDDNVPVTETFRLEKALIDAHRDVDVVILPNESHCARTPYFWRKFRDYFTLNLLGEVPPAGASLDLPPVSGK